MEIPNYLYCIKEINMKKGTEITHVETGNKSTIVDIKGSNIIICMDGVNMPMRTKDLRVLIAMGIYSIK